MIPLIPFQDAHKFFTEKAKDPKPQWWTFGKENADDFKTDFEKTYPDETIVLSDEKTMILKEQKEFSDACKKLDIKDLDKLATEKEALQAINDAIIDTDKKIARDAKAKEIRELTEAKETIRQFSETFKLTLTAFPAPEPKPKEDDKATSKIDTPSLMTPPKIPAATFKASCQDQLDARLGASKYTVVPNNLGAPDLSGGSKICKTSGGKQEEIGAMTPGKIELKGDNFQELAEIALVLLKQSGVPDGKELPLTANPKAFLKILMKTLKEAGYEPVEKAPEKTADAGSAPKPPGFP